MAELSRLGQPDQSGWTTLDRIGAAARKAREYISPWGVVSPTDVAGFAPGGGLVQAWQDSGRGLANLKAGNYGQAAADYGSMALNTAGELMPVAKLGMAMFPAAKKAGALADIGKVEPQGITAYHGSPHDFDRFDMSKIGTGEGAQAYGHGLYFAQDQNVARAYQDALRRMKDEVTFDGKPLKSPADYTALQKELEETDWRQWKAVDEITKRQGDYIDRIKEVRDWYRDNPEMLKAIAAVETRMGLNANPGSLYQVRINANPDDFLDWDKPLSEQSERVRKALWQRGQQSSWQASGANEFTRVGPRGVEATVREAVRIDKPEWKATYDTLDGQGSRWFPTREEAQKWIDTEAPIEGGRGAEIYQGMRKSMQDADITRQLREAGIPGIKYLDAGSRGAGDGTRNYVVFDDKLVEILKKYGWVPGMAIPAAAMMEYQQQGGSAPQM